MVKIREALGKESWHPVVKCYISCQFYDGWVDAVRAPIKSCSVLIGNVEGVIDQCPNCKRNISHKCDESLTTGECNEVVTRSKYTPNRIHPLVVPNLNPINISPSEFAVMQNDCPTLKEVKNKLQNKTVEKKVDGSEFLFIKENGIIYRKCIKPGKSNKLGKKVLVVPLDCRKTILSIAHEAPMAGHFSHRKTEMKICESFFWPGAPWDVRNFCRSCDQCQRMGYKGKVKPVPLCKVPVFTEPFSRVAIDIVGPLNPSSAAGHKYILTLIDYASGFPEAVALRDIDAISVSEALLEIFSRVGIPKSVVSDNGKQFRSELMAQLHKLLGVKPIFSSPYHPQGNSRVERLHSTLKSSLRKVCAEKPRDWHRYIAPTLFALREMPSDRTGFSAFELIYGRQIRGPLSVLRDLWEDSSNEPEERECMKYIFELRKKLKETWEIAAKNSTKSSAQYKSYFDLKSQDRKFVVGDEVLLLLPSSNKKLLMAWKGPYKVVGVKNRINYLIDQDGTINLYHANLLKMYHRRAQLNTAAYVIDEVSSHPQPETGDTFCVARACVVDTTDDTIQVTSDDSIITPLRDPEGGVVYYDKLNAQQIKEAEQLVNTYPEVFSDKPGLTNAEVHDIKLKTSEPVRSKIYPVPIHLKHHFDREVDELLELGRIRPSKSPYCSPVVLVKKPNSDKYRLAVDYRNINSITEFQAEPACRVEEDLHLFKGAVYFSELDLTKAYYQVPLTESARPITAFPTYLGLMEFTCVPFGLITACATYIRLMRKLLSNVQNVTFYFDNIFIFNKTWEEHLNTVQEVLEILKRNGLTARPSKCNIGFDSVDYLGFKLTGEEIMPQESKVEAILRIPVPTTKKKLRSFLGLISFYRKFLPQAASLTANLSNLLRKDFKEPLHFDEETLASFGKLKTMLAEKPVLKLPDIKSTFILRTDASNVGVGAILLQYKGEDCFPIAYASRKLTDCEKRYSTIEKECLAIIFGINKFNYYLLGAEFVLETDHKPLVYMNNFKGSNPRLLRWALSLQAYYFRIVHVKGVDNIGADILSRAH